MCAHFSLSLSVRVDCVLCARFQTPLTADVGVSVVLAGVSDYDAPVQTMKPMTSASEAAADKDALPVGVGSRRRPQSMLGA